MIVMVSPLGLKVLSEANHFASQSHLFQPEASQDPENDVDFNEDSTSILEQFSYE